MIKMVLDEVLCVCVSVGLLDDSELNLIRSEDQSAGPPPEDTRT